MPRAIVLEAADQQAALEAENPKPNRYLSRGSTSAAQRRRLNLPLVVSPPLEGWILELVLLAMPAYAAFHAKLSSAALSRLRPAALQRLGVSVLAALPRTLGLIPHIPTLLRIFCDRITKEKLQCLIETVHGRSGRDCIGRDNLNSFWLSNVISRFLCQSKSNLPLNLSIHSLLA
jgi:hypothetical protein